MSIDATIVDAIETGTTVRVYPLQFPAEGEMPCVVYKLVDEVETISHVGRTKFYKARYQFTLLAQTYSGLRGLVEDFKDCMTANTTDFDVAVPVGTAIELEEDGMPYSIRDYYILWSE